MATNLIYFCVFHNKNYTELAYLLLKSLHNYGELDNTVDILIYTSTEFAMQMRLNPLCQTRVIFKTNDNYTSIPSACRARLDIFEFPEIQGYTKIMYLDTDILIRHNIKPVFDIVKKDLLYALEEGSLDMQVPYDYWGKTFFIPGEIEALEDKTAFSSGVLLFRNSENIAALFQRIKTHMDKGEPHEFHDQPYIVYNTIRAGLSDNKALKPYVAINEVSTKTMKTILHFAGSPGDHESKIVKMSRYMNQLETKETVVTSFGSCRVAHTKNNTRLSDVLTYTHTTKEVLQLIRFLKGGIRFFPPYNTICFRTAILQNRAADYNIAFKSVFENTDTFVVEICSRKKYMHADLCLHDISVDKRFPDLNRGTPAHILEEYTIEEQTDEEIRQDILEIRRALHPRKMIIVSHYNALLNGEVLPSRNRLICLLKEVCATNAIPFLDPTEALKDYPQEQVITPDLSHYTQFGMSEFTTSLNAIL
jgi:lipopolysaccharide biosynthesis glycosyltransferase